MLDAVVGNPDTIARRVQELADIGINHLLLRFVGEWAGETQAISLDSMRLFANEVAPRFRQLAPQREMKRAAAGE
jgi:hypothetical protein